MQKEIHGISYRIKNTKRTRNISITIQSDGNIVVAKHPRISAGYIEKLMNEKIGWIKERLHEQSLRPKKILAQYSVKDFKKQKEVARILVASRLKYFNQFYNYKIGKIFIRNQKSRWGSCSNKGNLNFNYKLVFLPLELTDYIIVHELCHRGEMNHSKRFWNLVAQQIPDFKERRKKIKLF